MASLKFRHYATESDLKGTGEIQNALNAFDVGTIVFIDDTQKQYIITGKNNNVVTYKIYYGKAAIVGVTGTGATRTLTFSDGSEITITINDVEHATTSDSCSGNAKSATTLQTARKINGTNFNGSADITTSKWGEFRNIGIVNSDGTGTAVTVSVNGSSNVNLKLPETIKANLDGNASSATKATNDGSGNTITTTYATKTERANNDITAVSLTASKLTLTRTAGNITANIPTWNQNTTGTAAKATADANGNNIANTYATKAEVAALPKSMVIKGTLDASHTLPTSGMTEGDTYIVGAKGTYNNIACKVGDFFVRTSDSWLRIPAGDEWEYNENTIKAIKVDNAGYADTAGTATTAGNANTIGGISASKLVYGSNSTKTTDITEDQLNAPLASGFYTISNTTTGSSATIPNATKVSMILHTSYSGPDNNAGFDLLINDSETSSLHFRPATGAGKGAWKTLIDTGNIGLQSVNYAASSGACTGNSATATKLQTARTIWGQSFNGSGNVSGAISNTGNITPSATKTSDLGSNALSYRYIYATWVGAPSNTALSFGAANKEHIKIDTSGNVGIGTTSPTSKLHVAGTGYFTSDVSSASNIIAGGYIKGETVKISSGCTLQYDSAQKCVKFVFN